MSKHARSPSHGDDGLKHPSTKRAKEIDADTPLSELQSLLSAQKSSHPVRTVLHWFRSKDIRQDDNRALHAAAQKAEEANAALIAMYLFSPKDMEWHGTSPARSDFILESLRILKRELEEKNVPLAVVTADERGQKTQKVLEFVRQNDVSHVYTNFEYEVDELRRDIKVAKELAEEKDVSLEMHHDQTVLEPGLLRTGNGGPMKVFTPYHRAWLAELADNPHHLDVVPAPKGNSEDAAKKFKALFESSIPDLPESKQFSSDEHKNHIRELWPPGTEAGMKRLSKFLSDKVPSYASDRSEPAKDPSSRLSPYFSSGIVSVRHVLAETKKANKGKNFDSSGDAGIASWVREIVFREFYRQMLTTTPHNSMNLPQNLKFDFVHWEDDEEGWYKWCDGTTGVPFVDAGMRQLKAEAYMHNRARMNVSSYLRTNLLIDYRKGERFFAESLVDWDLGNNTQGWEPSYTVFNPVSQAEKNDPHGEYIRKWVPELKNVKGKAVFAPFERLDKKEFEKLGYPRPHVDFKESKDRAMSRYKQDLADADP